MGQTIPFYGFTPSLDPTTPGAILDCQNMLPTLRGMRSAPAMVPFGNPTFPSPVTGAATCELLTGAYRTIAGTGTKLFEVDGTVNTDVSAFAYSGAANKWRFAQFGNATLATNDADPIQQSIESGVFESIPSPLASIQVLTGGTYTSAPTVVISGAGGATATAVLTGSAVTSIVLTNAGGSANGTPGYSVTPTISFTGGGGTGAPATAVATVLYPPIAEIIETVQGFVFAFNTVDPVQGNRPHGWWCTALFDQTDWVPAQATQCAFGIIIDQPGEITAGKALGTNIIAYKRASMFYGVYQGPPVIWGFNQISPIVGTPSQECVVSIGTQHIFLGTDFQVYSFDGTIPLPIGDDVRDWLASNWSKTFQSSVCSYYDQPNSLIYWYFCSQNNTTGVPDLCLVYNHRTGKFGRADAQIEAACQGISGQITWDLLGSLPMVTTWSTLPTIPYNSPYWAQNSALPALIDTTNTMQSLSGISGPSSLTTGWFGDDYSYMYLQGVIPRFKQQPASCTGSAQSIAQLGSPNITQQTMGNLYDGELACDFSCRYASVTLNFTGNHEIMGAVPRLIAAGAI